MSEVILDKFVFPVKEKGVYVYSPTELSIEQLSTAQYKTTKNYKAIVRSDTDELISIMKNRYKIVTNEQVINIVMKDLKELSVKWKIDPSHSFVENRKMRIQIVFPELIIKDNDSDINLAAYISNSYDGTEGIRIYWGALRLICTNGMIAFRAMNKFYGRHTNNIKLGDLQTQFRNIYQKIPLLQNRINQLQEVLYSSKTIDLIGQQMGSGIKNYVIASLEKDSTEYDLLNATTYYISHNVSQRMRARYQQQTANIFEL